ncbi:MAG TPA: glutamate synthase [Candidatus Binatia bacterium]|nr:glutamate synthase [Candidatus Binatia bacterium]
MREVNCTGKTTREINQEIRRLIADGEQEIVILRPQARHNLGVATLHPVKLLFEGSVGYYCAGLSDGPSVEIRGSAGWGVAEGLLSGTVVVGQNAGNSTAAAMRGGTVVVRGSASARAGIAMKGGTLVIAGNCGYMTGFMMQKGTIIVCGNAGEALGDSMYAGRIFVGGSIAELGNDAVTQELTPEDREFLTATLARYGVTGPPAFQKVVAGRRLWRFDKKEFTTWREAL